MKVTRKDTRDRDEGMKVLVNSCIRELSKILAMEMVY